MSATTVWELISPSSSDTLFFTDEALAIASYEAAVAHEGEPVARHEYEDVNGRVYRQAVSRGGPALGGRAIVLRGHCANVPWEAP